MRRTIVALGLSLAFSAAAQEAGRVPQPIAAPAEPAPPVLVLPAESPPPAPAAQPPAAAPPAAPPAEPAGPWATVRLKDGQSLRGRVVSRDAAGLVLDLGGGVRTTVPKAQIEEVEEDRPGSRPGWRPDPNRTRYLYSPSGFMLKAGEVYFSQTELVFSSVNFGVTDFLTLGVGSAVPFLFASGGANLEAVAKIGGSLGDYVHVAGGAQVFIIPGSGNGGTVGFLFGTVTLGTPDAHFGVSVGPPFVTSGSNSSLGSLLVSVSGNLRLANAFALVSENWIVPSSNSYDSTKVVTSLAARIMGDHIAVDLGLIRVPDASVPVPWLDFTYNFR